jgi:hypothetical protein
MIGMNPEQGILGAVYRDDVIGHLRELVLTHGLTPFAQCMVASTATIRLLSEPSRVHIPACGVAALSCCASRLVLLALYVVLWVGAGLILGTVGRGAGTLWCGRHGVAFRVLAG